MENIGAAWVAQALNTSFLQFVVGSESQVFSESEQQAARIAIGEPPWVRDRERAMRMGRLQGRIMAPGKNCGTDLHVISLLPLSWHALVKLKCQRY